MSTPTPAPERSSVSTPGENVAYIASTSNSSLKEQPSPTAPSGAPSDPVNVDGAMTIKSGGVPLTAWQSNAAELAKLLTGKQLGPFLIEASLGTGGMAAVFKAYDVQLDRTVALKILPPVLAAHAEHVQRFEREAKVTAKLDDEHVARVHQYGQDQGLHYIAYEFVEGTNLRDLMAERGGRLPISDAVRFILQAARGLAHTAARGVVHRDIKPSNLVITADGKVKLVDLGLARACLAEETQDLTHSGATLGTFDYLAPEQAIDPRSADVRSDIYSLGCTLYHCVTGAPPVPQGTAARKLHSHQIELPTDPRELNPQVPDPLVEILTRMLAKRPEDRYQDADELVRDLEQLSTGKEVIPTKAPEASGHPLGGPADAGAWRIWLVGLVLLLGGLLGYDWLFTPNGRGPREEHSGTSPQAKEEVTQSARPDSVTSKSGEASAVMLEAKTTDDLLRALRHPAGGGTILLKGTSFELLPVTDQSSAVLIDGGEWRLQAAEGFTPVLRLRSGKAAASGLFDVRARSLELKRLRLEVPNASANVLRVSAGSQVTLHDCEVIQGEVREEQRPESLITMSTEQPEKPPASVQLRGCVLQGGGAAVEQRGAGLVHLEDCWIGPFRQLIYLAAAGTSAPKQLISLKRCCVVQPSQSCFYISNSNNARIEVERCLFSRTSQTRALTFDPSIWIVKEDGAGLDVISSGNVFHRLPAFYAIKSQDGRTEIQATDLNYVRNVLPRFTETGSTVVYRTPWVESRPWQRFKETRELAALLPKEDYREACPDSLLGQPFRSVTLSAKAAPSTAISPKGSRTLVVDGRGDEPGTFTTVNSALGSITDEEETTILVQQQGTVAVKPSELGNSRVVLRAAEGFRPTIVFHRDTVSGPDGDTALFRLHDGEITLEGLKVRLEPLRDPARSLSVVSLSGTGRCRLKDCLVTLKSGGEVATMVCLVADPTGMMVPQSGKTPRHGAARLELVDSFIRGGGEILHVQTSRPFTAQAQNCGAVLDGPAVVVEGNRADMSMPSELAQLILDRSTLHASRGLLHLHGTPSLPQLVGLRCQVSQCVLSTAEAQPLIRVDANQNDAEPRRKLTWRGSRNCYAAAGSLLVWQSLDRETTATQYDAVAWGELWGADDEQGQVMKSVTYVGTTKNLAAAEWEPTDLIPKLDAATSMSLRDVGMTPEVLPHSHAVTP